MPFDADPQQIDIARRIHRQSAEYRTARAIQVAVNVGVFASLAKTPATTAQLAERLTLNACELEKVLIALAAVDLLKRDGDAWALTESASIALDPDSPLYQGEIIAHMSAVWDTWHNLEARLRAPEGGQATAPKGPPMRDAHWHRHFILGMHNLAIAGMGAYLAAHVDLSGCRTLLDVGGGPGTYCMALCDRYPQLHATLFDLPQTLAIARTVVQRLGYTDRITFTEGDWNQPDYGGPFDAVLMSNILHGPTSDTPAKLAKAHRALAPGGLLIVQDFLMDADKTGPEWPALFNIMVGAWSITEITDRIAAAGFDHIAHQPMLQHSGGTLVTARKK